jgi:hypothetical protein
MEGFADLADSRSDRLSALEKKISSLSAKLDHELMLIDGRFEIRANNF